MIDAPGERWGAIVGYFRVGHRGLPDDTTLAKLLVERRNRRVRNHAPPLTIKQILKWADDFHARHGRWPQLKSGPIPGTCGETWSAVHWALYSGHRGLPGGSSLAKVFSAHRGQRNRGDLPRLSDEHIKKWGAAHHERTGRWPTRFSGSVQESPDDTWAAIELALYQGGRGLPGGITLPQFFTKHLGKKDWANPPKLTIEQILTWADEFRARTGRWPCNSSGPIVGAPGEHWSSICTMLLYGRRGLPRGTTINRLLAKHRGKRDRFNPPKLTIKQILALADAHFERTGRWPNEDAGRLVELPDESWGVINRCLTTGERGLPGRSSLPKLLMAHRAEAYALARKPLLRDDLLDWIAAHHELTGALPDADSGPVLDEPGEAWRAIDASLRHGTRRTGGRSSLESFIASHYREPYEGIGQPLSEAKIVKWIRDFRDRTGKHPTARSAYVFAPPKGVDRRSEADRPGERWTTIDRALREGWRGLPGKSSLAKLVRIAAGGRESKH